MMYPGYPVPYPPQYGPPTHGSGFEHAGATTGKEATPDLGAKETGTKKKPDESNDEDKTSARPGDEDKTSARPGDEDKISARPGDEDKTSARSGDEDKTSARPGDEDKTSARPGDVEKTPARPGDEDKTSAKPGDEKHSRAEREKAAMDKQAWYRYVCVWGRGGEVWWRQGWIS